MLKYLSYGYLFFIGIIILYANMGWDLFVFDLVKYVPFKDKLSHFLLVGMLTLVVNYLLKFRRAKISKYNFLLGSVLVFSFFTLEEASQALLANRNCELLDFICNSLGILIFEKIALKINAAKEMQKTP
ncbi:MAG: trypsin [Bacteroidota bacterium]